MLFMNIVTWDPKDNKEMERRYVEWNWPEGIDVISEWVDLSSCRFVGVYEVESAEAYAAVNLPWKDICWIDSFPVMRGRELIEFIAEHEM